MTAARILVDADACPVKDEIYRVAWRHETPVTIVSNARIRVPEHPLVTRIVVADTFDAADDWIAAQADERAVVVTADILLADRCLKGGATVLAPTGKAFLRAGGDQLGGPAPFSRTDRSRFLQALDTALVHLKR